MSASASLTDWADLSATSPDERHEGMVRAFGAISVLDEEARIGNCAVLLDQEASLDDRALQAMAASRFRALAAMDPNAAARVTAAFDRAEKQQPAAIGMRRVSALQTAARGLSLDEVSKVEAFMPAIREMAGLGPARREQPIAAGDLIVSAPAPKRGILARLFSRS